MASKVRKRSNFRASRTELGLKRRRRKKSKSPTSGNELYARISNSRTRQKKFKLLKPKKMFVYKLVVNGWGNIF